MVIIQLTSEQLTGIIYTAVRSALSEQTQQATTPAPDEFLTVFEAAALLNLEPATIYGLTHRKEIPHIKRGKRLYFPKAELTAWLKEGRQKTAAELREEAKQPLIKKRRD